MENATPPRPKGRGFRRGLISCCCFLLLALGISTALIFIEGAIIDWWLGDNDQLADLVIDGVKKFRRYIPLIIELKKRFDDGKRNSDNRLKEPIKGCHSWEEFCGQCPATEIANRPKILDPFFRPRRSHQIWIIVLAVKNNPQVRYD